MLGQDDDDETDADEDDRSASEDSDEDRQEEEDDDEDEDVAAAKRTLEMAKKATGSAFGDDKKKKKKAAAGPRAKAPGGEEGGAGRPGAASPASSGPYRAPRLASVPYRAGGRGDEEERDGRRDEKERRKVRRLRAGEVATALRSKYSDAPEVEDAGGGAELGRQREASRRWAERERERTAYEESAFVRLAPSRKEKQQKKKVMREEMSNLNALADLGSLVVRGLDGDEDGAKKPSLSRPSRRDSGIDAEDGQGRYSNGKRKRSGEGATKRGGSGGFRSTNSLQAALYEGGGGKGKRKGKR
jgi:hypothetical protein